MAFIGQDDEDEQNLEPCSPHFSDEYSQSSEFRIRPKTTLGTVDTPTYCVRFDHNDKYVAAAKGDGSIEIYNLFTGKRSYICNEGMENAMPTTVLRWRPHDAPGVTKNVMLATNAEGSLMHFHTTSGRMLHKIYDPLNQLLTADYKPDGKEFLTGGSDTKVRVYDEQTRQLKLTLEGGGGGQPGHMNRVFCAKFVPEDHNLVVSGGWDKNVKVWDLRIQQCVRSIIGPYIAGDSIDVHDGFILTGQFTQTNQLQLWYLHSGEKAEDIPFNDKLASAAPVQLYTTQFQKNNYDLIIAGGQGHGANEVKIFDGDNFFEPCHRIFGLSRACYSSDFSNSGEMFAIGGGDGVVRVFDVTKER